MPTTIIRRGATVLAVALPLFTGAARAQGMQHASAAAQPPSDHQLYVGAVLFDRLEYGFGLDRPNIMSWDGQGWFGTDTNRVWVKTRGETARNGRVENAEGQVLYSRLLAYYWDIQAGIRYDIRPQPGRAYAVIGLQGLAPGMFEVDLQAFVSQEGDVSARAKASYDIYVTQRLVLQPEIEANFAIQRVSELGIGSGITDIEAGLRLRYEITREFAPYVGVSYERRLGDTARFARNAGESVGGWSLVTGIRLFF